MPLDDLVNTIQPRDDKTGKYLPKRPLEFTFPHFWLEVGEVWLAILLAQATWEGIAWLVKVTA